MSMNKTTKIVIFSHTWILEIWPPQVAPFAYLATKKYTMIMCWKSS